MSRWNCRHLLIESQSVSIRHLIEAVMSLFCLTLVLIGVNFELANSKEFQQCEFAVELFEKHQMPRDEIYKHLCIVKRLVTTDNFGGHLGMYGIGSMWWCSSEGPGGSCNVTCASLVDDDIADDIVCANLILSQQGVEAFGKVLSGCKTIFEPIVNECIAGDENLLAFEDLGSVFTTTQMPETTTKATTTTQTTTTQIVYRRTTTKRPARTKATTQSALLEEEQGEDEGADAIVWVICALLIALLITFLVVKFKKFKPSEVSYQQTNAFENSMSNLWVNVQKIVKIW